MRKTTILIMLAVVLTMATVSLSMSGEPEKFQKVIPGYPLNESAIKGEPEQHLLLLKKEIDGKRVLYPYPTYELIFSVAGRTDKTGSKPENDKLGRERAENVAGFLGSEYPEAKIKVWSEGQKKNAREVWVQYWFSPIPPPKSIIVQQQSSPPQKESGSRWWIALVAVVCGTGLTAFLITRIRKQQPQAESKSPKVREYRREAGNKSYVIPVEVRADGLFGIPIKYVRDGKPVIKNSWPHVKNTINGFLEDPAYASQVKEFEQAS